jgi:iron uptake system component EfeO
VRRSFLVLLAVPFAVAACSSSGSSSGSSGDAAGTASAARSKATQIDVTLSDNGCDPRSISAQAGPTTFRVTNDGTAAVTEFEVLDGSRILGEVENVIPGGDGNFSLTLKAGSYTTKCPGGSQFDHGTLEVAEASTRAAADTAARTATVATYLTSVKGEADQLVAAIGPFTDAVKAGDSTTAKNLYASTRAHYEAIEPIAESFGDLDPAIDAREGDGPDAEWGGFHRMEKALWAEDNLAGMATVADKLVADVKDLRGKIDTIELEPAQIANGAVELLDEVSTSKITGEEDRYSHTDLSDFAANLAGSKAAFGAVQPLLGAEGGLSTQIEQQFTAVQTALDAHRGTDPTGNGYVLYVALTPDQTRALSAAVDALAEPLSRVAAQVL